MLRQNRRFAYGRRALIACALGLGGRTGASAQSGPVRWIDVWVDLDEPPSAAQDGPSAPKGHRQRLAEQQERVARSLRQLGAVELGRVRHVRNAIAVRLPADRLDEARAIAGVVRVRPASRLHPPKPMP